MQVHAKEAFVQPRQMYRFFTIKIRNVRKLVGRKQCKELQIPALKTIKGTLSPSDTNGEKNCEHFLKNFKAFLRNVGSAKQAKPVRKKLFLYKIAVMGMSKGFAGGGGGGYCCSTVAVKVEEAHIRCFLVNTASLRMIFPQPFL
jgi:hypothetical protein